MTGGIPSWWIDFILRKPLRCLVETPKRMLKGYVKPGMTVLDVGCGSGDYSLAMARLVGSNGRVVSIDLKVETIATLKERAARAGLSGRIQARVCGERDLEVGDLTGQVNFALAIYVVHHAADATSLMRNVHGALKPGGTLLVMEPQTSCLNH